jgi:prepilin-type N-terminal cleavage/methylation domain-containing protein
MDGLLRRARVCTRDEAGFGMIELVCAMTIMSIGVMALFAMFQTGMTAVKRASAVSTASALADSEMEGYRAIKFEAIGLGQTAVQAADSTYTSATAYLAISSPANQTSSTAVVTPCGSSPCTNSVPTKTVTGADGRSYRVDTYVTWKAITNSSGLTGRDTKLVTIVVRDSTTLRTYARVSSTFDLSTGL